MGGERRRKEGRRERGKENRVERVLPYESML